VNPEAIEPALLNWRGNQPFAPRYDDIYYSDDGLEEFQRVFLQPSSLLDRDDLAHALQVAELGFGYRFEFCAVCPSTAGTAT